MPGKPLNLFACRPVRVARWEDAEDGLVVLLVPRFRARILARYLLPRLRSPEYRVRLDAMGSHVWRLCSGSATVLEIAESVWRTYGGTRDTIDERVAAFVVHLEREGLIQMEKPETLLNRE